MLTNVAMNAAPAILAFGFAPNLWEILLILMALLLLFGKRLPEVGRSLGRGLVEFKKGMRGVEEEMRAVDVQAEKAAAASAAASTAAASAPKNLPNVNVANAQVATIACPKCAHQVQATAKWCPECGTKMVQETADVMAKS